MSSGEQTIHQGNSSWRQRLNAHLALARVSNSPTVVSNVLAGTALAGVTGVEGRVGLVALALVLFYAAGMYLNDVFDYAIDRESRPERPLPSGLISRTGAAATSALLFLGGGTALLALGPRPFLAGIALIAIIVLYDVWHKTNPLSPLVMGACRVMVYIIAFVTFQPQVSGGLAVAAGALALYIIGFSAIAKTEGRPQAGRGSVKDADIGRGVGSPQSHLPLATGEDQRPGPTLGPVLTRPLRHWPACFAFAPVGVLAIGAPGPLALALCAGFLAWTAYSLSFAYVPTRRSIGGAIARLIAGVSLVDALVLAVMGAGIWVPVALAAFGLTLFFQRFVRGT